jgi:hypothetical protein
MAASVFLVNPFFISIASLVFHFAYRSVNSLSPECVVVKGKNERFWAAMRQKMSPNASIDTFRADYGAKANDCGKWAERIEKGRGLPYNDYTA